MIVRAGDIRQMTINSREFDPAPESSCTILAGGYANEVAPTGNGEVHGTQKRKLPGIKGFKASIDDSRQDLEFLAEIQDAGEAVPVTITLAGGITYAGSLVLIADELGKDTGEGTTEFDLVGKKFEQVA